MRSKPVDKDELTKKIFLCLLEHREVKDKAAARELVLASAHIAGDMTRVTRAVPRGNTRLGRRR